MLARAIARSPERVAWTVLLGSFFILVALVASLVFGGNWWLRNASIDQSIKMDANGTVLVTRPGRSAAEVNLTDIPVNSVIRTERNAQASLTFSAPGTGAVLGTVRIFGSTIVEIGEAESPRFSTGVNPHSITLHVTSGRVRATVAVDPAPAVRITIRSDPGAATVLDTPGSNVSVEAAATETMVTVRDGQAEISAVGGTVTLGKDQRAEVLPEAAPVGPLPAEQNLVKDGDFTQPLAGFWTVVAPPPFDPSEKKGTVDVVTNGGQRALRLSRAGNNNARVGVTQDINRDVQGLTSLRLNLDIFLDTQDLRNCGLYGTECPLMVRITYVDVGGGEKEWLQGFFWYYDPNPAFGLTYCGICAVRFVHLQWPFGKWGTYTSPDLLTIFTANGAPAVTIKSITIYGEGHTFTSLFADVQLLASE